MRSRVLALLEGRWDRRVTLLVAGAGFGKTVALGQALRANQARPQGVEGWVSCRAGCATPDRMVASIEAALGIGPGADAPPLPRLQRAFAELAPVEVSLVLDDVEDLGTAGRALVDGLLRAPPANAHLVLSGRPPRPALALARFRAADDLLEITEDDLRFDDGEIAALAAGLGVAAPTQDLAGWPALVRLAVSSPEGTIGDYLWEEVIRGLAATDRRVLLALCILGASTVDEIAEVTGAPVDADGFCARVPLVHRAGGRLVAHGLWAPHRHHLAPPAELDGVQAKAMAAVATRGDPVPWGELAVRSGDMAALRRAAVALVRATLGSLPVEIADEWLARLVAAPGPGPDADVDSPETHLLRAAVAHARVAAEPSAEELDRVVERFLAADDAPGEAVAVALAALAAGARGDLVHLVVLAGRARELAGRHADPLLDLLVAGVDAAAAALAGDLSAALERLEALPAEEIVGSAVVERPEALVRLHWHLLLLAGRADDAARLVAGLRPHPRAAAERELEGVARWFGGDPSALLTGTIDTGPGRYRALSDRDRFDQAGFVAVIAASAGDVEAVDRAVDVLVSSPFSASAGGADAAVVAAARAGQAILRHDEDRAVALVDALLAGDLPDLPDVLTDAHLRRSLAIPYVCSARLRRRWDGDELGPSQRQARAAAQGFVAARAGRVPSTAPAPFDAVLTALPLPWTAELAARAVESRVPWGSGLVLHLAERFGDTAADALARLTRDRDPRVAGGARRARATVPVRPPGTTEIRVLGPLELRRDGRPVDAPELRRQRVRELLGLLVAERSVTRDRAVDVLWPDLDPDRARTNLRVTLGHLQRLLEPDRPPRSAPYHLRADADHLRLTDAPGLAVDAWQLDHHLAAAGEAARVGDQPRRMAHLRAAVDRWRGRPLPDLDRTTETSHHGSRLEARLVDAAITLGELELVAGAAAAAASLAERVLAASPYDERAHRLAIAAALQSRDPNRTTAAIHRLHATLADLGTDPDPTTRMLLRHTTHTLHSPPTR